VNPDYNIHMKLAGWRRVLLVGLIGGLSALLLAQMAARGGAFLALSLVLVLPMLGFLWFLAFGGKHRVDAWWRRRTWYWLTDQRVIVRTRAFGLTGTTSWSPETWNALHWNGRDPGNVQFRRVLSRRAGAHVHALSGISGAGQVFGLMRAMLPPAPPR
jgi:hypothetical protein